MRTRILFSDLDGTLLDDDKNVSRKVLSRIDEMINMGHRFAIATGRPVFSAKVVAKELGLYRDGVFLMASNGGVVYDCTRECVISACHLETDVVDDLFKAAGAEGLHVHTYTDSHVVSLRRTPELIAYCERIRMPYRILSAIPEELPAPPPKLIVISAAEGSRHILKEFERSQAELVAGRAQSVFSNDFLLEYLPPGVSKGNALIRLCALLGIPVEDSVAAGDEANDIPMLDAAGAGVAMRNATDETKSHADYVTKLTNNEGGIEEVISRFFA